MFFEGPIFLPQNKNLFQWDFEVKDFSTHKSYVSTKKAGSFKALFCSALFILTNMYLAFFSDASNWEAVVSNIRIFSKNRYTTKNLILTIEHAL